ncbi:MAG: hypothetical protein ACKVOO_04810 [Burkholderiaceae bacterium]
MKNASVASASRAFFSSTFFPEFFQTERSCVIPRAAANLPYFLEWHRDLNEAGLCESGLIRYSKAGAYP